MIDNGVGADIENGFGFRDRLPLTDNTVRNETFNDDTKRTSTDVQWPSAVAFIIYPSVWRIQTASLQINYFFLNQSSRISERN